MSISTGLLLITALAFIISMIVATIIWILGEFNSFRENGFKGQEKKSLLKIIKAEADHFRYFQRLYRTYWESGNAPTNELITFYHEQ